MSTNLIKLHLNSHKLLVIMQTVSESAIANLQNETALELDDEFPKCKICFQYKNPSENSTIKNDLISPCGCKGSIKYVHKSCLRLWRFKGKHIREIKRCEQCCCDYKIDEDYMPHGYLVNATTFTSIIIVLFIGNQVLNSVVDSISFLVDETFYENGENCTNQNINNKFYRNDIKNMQGMDQKYKDFQSYIREKHYTSVSFLTSSSAIYMVYSFACCWSFWPVMNYLFTGWRVFYFNFFFDRILLMLFGLYYARKMYREIYGHIETMFIFLLNYRH